MQFGDSGAIDGSIETSGDSCFSVGYNGAIQGSTETVDICFIVGG